jgi:hypothetical protein
LTIDEEFNKLEDDLRRLKIEYEVYFNGSSPRPPQDTLFRVENVLKRYMGDQSKLNMGQRFRLLSLAQKFAVNMNLWRRKLQEKEEGRSLGGAPQKRARAKEVAVAIPKGAARPIRVTCSDPDNELEKVTALLDAMKRARFQVREPAGNINPAAFHKFIKEKTHQVQEKLGCEKVQFSVSIEDGKVKFKAGRAE